VAEFKLLAETAQRMADKAENEAARVDYLKIAKDWLDLATEIELERQVSLQLVEQWQERERPRVEALVDATDAAQRRQVRAHDVLDVRVLDLHRDLAPVVKPRAVGCVLNVSPTKISPLCKQSKT